MYVAPEQKLTLARRGARMILKHLIGCHRLDCPVCGPGVAEREAADIALAVTEHYARGGTVALVTLTLRHVRTQALLALLVALGKAWTTSRTSKTPRGLWAALTDGYIRKLEVTFGRNGWHPHLHLLVFLKAGVTADDLDRLCSGVFASWAAKLVDLGMGEPTRENGVSAEILTLESAQERVADYVAKDAGRELASAGTKKGRRGGQSTYELLQAAVAGDPRAGLRFLEYEDAMKGRHRIEWSSGLKLLLLGDDLPETADPDVEALDVAVFTDDGGRVVLRNERYALGPGLAQLLRWGNVYGDDWEAFSLIARKCAQHGIPPPTPAARLGEIPTWVTEDLRRSFSGPVQPAQVRLFQLT